MNKSLIKLAELAKLLDNNQLYVEADIITKTMEKLSAKSKLPQEGVEYGHKTPQKGDPKSRKLYGDPKNFKYPLDTEKKVRAAWSYIHMPRNRKIYTAPELSAIETRIRAAGKKYNIDFREESGPGH